jgi:hypothetical protein
LTPDAPGAVEGAVAVVGAGVVAAGVVDGLPGPPVAEPAPDRLEVLVDREDDEPAFRRPLRPVSRFVVEGFVASAGVSLGDAAGFAVGAGVAASAAGCGLGVVAVASADGAGAVVESAAGVLGGAASPLAGVVPPAGGATVPLLLVVAVELAAGDGAEPPSATATLAVPRLVSAMAKAAPTKTRPSPRRPPGRSGRWSPTLRTAARRVMSHKESRASRRPKFDRLSKSNRTGCTAGKV